MELHKKIMSAKFDFSDFLKQTQNVKMGSMSRVIRMIPGMNKLHEPVGFICSLKLMRPRVWKEDSPLPLNTAKPCTFFVDSLEELEGLVITLEENDWLEETHYYITMMVRHPFKVQMYAMFDLLFSSLCYSFTRNFVWKFWLLCTSYPYCLY